MASSTAVSDLGSQYRQYDRSEKVYRPIAATTYTPGSLLQLVSQDLQPFTDEKGVQLPGTGANQQSLVGFVADTWNGFSGSISSSYTSPTSITNLRGTLAIDVVTQGYHTGVLVDQSGAGAVTIVDKLPLVASRATSGYVQGGSASAPPAGTATVANAVLPASGIGSSITAAALAQASQTATVATPAAGDVLTVTIQSPYVSTAPGVAQTTTWSTPPLTTAQAASATTAAAALAAYLNSQSNFSNFFTATSALGVVTITVNTSASLFRVNFGSGSNVTSFFDISLSGMIANSLTFAAGVVGSGGTTNTAGGANLAGGTGFKGYMPALVTIPGGG